MILILKKNINWGYSLIGRTVVSKITNVGSNPTTLNWVYGRVVIAMVC